MDKNLSLYYDCAKKLKLRVIYLPELESLEIKLGKKYLFMPKVGPLNNCTSISLVKNKQLRYALLKEANFPVPKALTLAREHFDEKVLDFIVQELKFPLVIRPTKETVDAMSCSDIVDKTTLLEQIRTSFQNYSFLQVEEFHSNLKKYRVLMLNKRIIDVVEGLNSMPFQGKVHPNNAKCFAKVANVIGLDFVSFDILCDDLCQSFHHTKWMIIDVNFDPDISLVGSNQQEIATKIMKQLIYRHPVAYLLQRLGVRAHGSKC